jgi:hypothetical protein
MVLNRHELQARPVGGEGDAEGLIRRRRQRVDIGPELNRATSVRHVASPPDVILLVRAMLGARTLTTAL